jgi:hypothetical protein
VNREKLENNYREPKMRLAVLILAAVGSDFRRFGSGFSRMVGMSVNKREEKQ